MALALISAIDFVANNPVSGATYKPYLDIPENDKNFYDVIVRNALLNPSKPGEFNDLGIQHTEVLESCVVLFKPKVVFVGDLTQKYGHMEIMLILK